jgi:hypothetical protein
MGRDDVVSYLSRQERYVAAKAKGQITTREVSLSFGSEAISQE